MNKYGGVIGIFNCQGAGSWPGLESNANEGTNLELSGKVSPSDIEYFEELSAGKWTQDCAVFRFSTGMVGIVCTIPNVSMILFKKGFNFSCLVLKMKDIFLLIFCYNLKDPKFAYILLRKECDIDSICNFRVSNTTIKGRIN